MPAINLFCIQTGFAYTAFIAWDAKSFKTIYWTDSEEEILRMKNEAPVARQTGALAIIG